MRSARDQDETGFTAILRALVRRVPGARAAVLVDVLGETVDYAGAQDPYGLRVAAAHWRIVLDEASKQSLGPIQWIAVRAGRSSFLVCALPEGYALVVALSRGAGFSGWSRAVSACRFALGLEAGWTEPRGRGARGVAWFAVDVVSDERRRPSRVRVAGHLRPLDILGALVAKGMARRERGWRVRFHTGIEATLVREAGGVWYADELLEAAPKSETHAAPAHPQPPGRGTKKLLTGKPH